MVDPNCETICNIILNLWILRRIVIDHLVLGTITGCFTVPCTQKRQGTVKHIRYQSLWENTKR